MPKDSITVADPIAEAARQWVAHGWPEAAAGMATVTTVVRVHQLLMARIEAGLAPLGLTFARFEILRLLGFSRTGRLPMGKIGERLMVHPATVTSAVNRLERDRLLTRVPGTEDSRMVLACLEQAGRERLDQATVVMNRVFEEISSAVPGLDELVHLLNGIRSWAGDTPAPA